MLQQVEEVKSKTDIVTIISQYVDLKKAGRNYKANCPFHSEKTPSFMVSPELQMYKCFGCGESGDVISFLEKYDGMEFYEALKYLAQKAGIKLEPTGFQQKGDKEKLYLLNSYAAKFYEYVLLNHKAGKIALSYLTENRGLSIDTIRSFNLGYSPDVAFALKNFLVGKKGFHEKDLENAGIVYKTERGYFDRFRGRVIFPLFDHRENVIGFAGRILPQDEDKKFAKYINTPETLLYHKSNVLYGLNLSKKEIKKQNKAIVVEGELDLISTYQIGIKNTVALKGSAFSKEQARLLGRYSKNVTLCMDSDIAGDQAAMRGINIAESEGLDVSVIELKEYKDPDDIARKNPELFKKIISKPIGVWDFIIDTIVKKHSVKTGQAKSRISKELMPILSSINDDIVKAHYVKKTADLLDVPFEAVMQETLKTTGSEEKNKSEDMVDQIERKGRRELLEERLISLMLQGDTKLVKKYKSFDMFKSNFCKLLVGEIRSFVKKNKWDVKNFSALLPAELKSGFNDLYLRGALLKDGNVDPGKETEIVVMELKALEIKEKLVRLTDEIKELEKIKKPGLLRKKQREYRDLTNKFLELGKYKL